MMARKITITPVLNGWIAQVGCQTVVFDNLDAMSSELVAYYRDPEGTEERYLNNRRNDVGGETTVQILMGCSPELSVQESD
jgi:hypothetical protein